MDRSHTSITTPFSILRGSEGNKIRTVWLRGDGLLLAHNMFSQRRERTYRSQNPPGSRRELQELSSSLFNGRFQHRYRHWFFFFFFDCNFDYLICSIMAAFLLFHVKKKGAIVWFSSELCQHMIIFSSSPGATLYLVLSWSNRLEAIAAGWAGRRLFQQPRFNTPIAIDVTARQLSRCLGQFLAR